MQACRFSTMSVLNYKTEVEQPGEISFRAFLTSKGSKLEFWQDPRRKKRSSSFGHLLLGAICSRSERIFLKTLALFSTSLSPLLLGQPCSLPQNLPSSACHHKTAWFASPHSGKVQWSPCQCGTDHLQHL